jgi:MHS family proline/betaine transporter-like MFS transporter
MSDKISLTIEQKQVIGILSFGTFLEYFDLMLYVHMAVLLNDLFFSTTDNFSASLLSAFSFCATFIFRPIGALLIGWVGDTYGRKSTIILTTSIMAISCIAMALLPTYDQVGILASVGVTLCRIIQGMSSMGERLGAEIYVTELVRPPKVYPAVAFITICAVLGITTSLFVAKLSLSYNFNWRNAFWFGGIVAVVGIFARTRLRETPDFADAKRELYKLCGNLKIDKRKLQESLVYAEKINKKSAISYFVIQLAHPVWFYFTYIHCANILKHTFHCAAEEIISHNCIVAIAHLLQDMFIGYLSSVMHPLKILKIRYFIIIPFLLLSPILLNNVSSPVELIYIQIFLLMFAPSEYPASPIFYKSFPLFKRFTGACFCYATARALMYLVTSFGIVYLIKYFGNVGLLFLFVPVITGYGFALFHFVNLEKQKEKEDTTYVQESLEVV